MRGRGDAVLIDALVQFGCPLERLADWPLDAGGLTLRRMMGQRGLDMPPLDAVADAPPLSAWIQQSMLVVTCEHCAGTPDEQLHLVYRDGPYLTLCTVCGNVDDGFAWRRVELPPQLDEIERALSVRPRAARSWLPNESVDDLYAENRRFGWANVALVESEVR